MNEQETTAELDDAADGQVADGQVADDASEDEGDVAADYIEELLDIANIDGDIDIDTRQGRSYITVSAPSGSSLDRLAAPDAVAALQELARLAVQSRTGSHTGVVLDIGGSRDARAEELARIVDHAIERLEGGAAAASLPPMSSYERKLVHDLAAERGFVSESTGEGRDRHTVIRRP